MKFRVKNPSKNVEKIKGLNWLCNICYLNIIEDEYTEVVKKEEIEKYEETVEKLKNENERLGNEYVKMQKLLKLANQEIRRKQ